jgi:CheY-like chemotaxis protein
MEKRVVVVDDDPDMIEYMRQVLVGAGYRVFPAMNGKEGIETALRVTPDVVLLDVLMPVVQGYDVCRYLKSRIELKDTKIVYITTMSGHSDRQMARDSGADGFIAKPVGVRELLDTIKYVTAPAE